jgi:hypothetical protein
MCAGAPARARGPEHLEYLPFRRRGCVRGAKADGDRASAEAILDAAAHRRHFLIGRSTARRRTGREKGPWIIHDGHANRDVSDGHAVVDELSGRTLTIPAVDIAGADFQLEDARHAVESRVAVVLRVLAVPVQVDEAGRHHEPARLDPAIPLQRRRVDGDDLPCADADVPHRVEARLGIQDAPVRDDEVQLLRLCGGERQGEQKDREEDQTSAHGVPPARVFTCYKPEGSAAPVH